MSCHINRHKTTSTGEVIAEGADRVPYQTHGPVGGATVHVTTYGKMWLHRRWR